MIDMTIHYGGKGRETSTHGDASARSLTALARLLVERGVPDQAWRAGRKDHPWSLSGRSLHGLACLDAQDDDSRTGWRWYVPHPKVEVGPVLAGVLATSKQARRDARER